MGVRSGGEGLSGCELRMEVIVKMKKSRGSTGGVQYGRGGGSQGGFEPKIEVIMKMQKSWGVGVRSGVVCRGLGLGVWGMVCGMGVWGCLKCIKVLYNLKNHEKIWGGGAIFEPKTL